jgi:hypothetical protein
MQTQYLQTVRAGETRTSPGDLDPDGTLSLEPDIDVTFTNGQVLEVQEHDLMIRERNRQLQETLRGMEQLQEMFSDLGMMIIEHGTILDRVDRTVDAALDEVREGNRNLAEAETHQKSGHKCFFIYIALMVVLILILGSVILIRKKTSSSGDSGGGDDTGGE